MFGSSSFSLFVNAETKSDQEDSLDFSQPWQFSDVVLVVEEDRFHVHRCILGMWSEVFTRMFTSHFKEKTAKEIPLPGKKSAEIKEMLLVIYPMSAKPISESNYAFLLDLAKEYMMAKLTEKCETYLMNRLFPRFRLGGGKDCYELELLEIAQNHGLNRLQTACIEAAKKMKFKDLKNHNMYEKISSSNYRKIVEGMFEIYERELAGRGSECPVNSTRLFHFSSVKQGGLKFK
ncbi:unnamed protein product [Porites evermanni]|uniref:BTB domain-containing protein n=1 Tax=Porites evermanni TaxID=104178 RepID=A0ABN8SNH7_9CNID|nr:unnamed protein product [Porites evermanni]